MKNIKQYYKELGKLVYAVSMADGIIQPEEEQTIHEFVLKHLADHEASTDSSGMNQAFYVDFEFEDSAEKHTDSSKAIQEFSAFLHKSFEPGDEKLVRLSFELIEKVAMAYQKAKERQMISEIRSEIAGISGNILKN